MTTTYLIGASLGDGTDGHLHSMLGRAFLVVSEEEACYRVEAVGTGGSYSFPKSYIEAGIVIEARAAVDDAGRVAELERRVAQAIETVEALLEEARVVGVEPGARITSYEVTSLKEILAILQGRGAGS